MTVGPELLERTDQPRFVDRVPEQLTDTVFRGPLIQVGQTQALMSVPDVADWSLDRVGGVVARRHPSATVADVSCFLTGPVRALDLTMRGVLCLRAAAVRVGSGAVVLCGASAAGKSVLASVLAARGHDLLADHLVPVAIGTGGPGLWPTSGAVQLWPPAARLLGLDPAAGAIVRPALPKRSYEVGPRGSGALVPLSRLVVLTTRLQDGAPTVRTGLDGGNRVRALSRCQWHASAAERLDPLGRFAALAELAAAVPIEIVTRPQRRWTADELADRVEAMAG